MVAMKKRRRASIGILLDGLTGGKVLTLIRYREYDHALHSFEFQLERSEDPQFRCVERFENGIAQEEYMDIQAIAMLCNWLLYLNFQPNLYTPYSDNEEN